jgi:hypothetical protein
MEAYVAALYWVDLPTGRINLRIGQSFEPPRGIGSHTRLAVVTACNPFSELLGDAENNARQASLVEAVEAVALERFHAAGVDAQEKWAPEPSLAILDPSDQHLDGWMEASGQNAVVVAEAVGLAALRLHPRHISDRTGAVGEVAQTPTWQTVDPKIERPDGSLAATPPSTTRSISSRT